MNEEEKNQHEQNVFTEELASTSEHANGGQKRTSTGLEQNVAGLLCYVLGFVTGVIFILIEKDNRFVRFHAWQSAIVFGGLFVVNLILSAIPILGWLIGILLIPVMIILWIVMMMKAYQGKMTKLPIIGEMAEKQVAKS